MKTSVVGTRYMGLVSGVCLLDFGYEVTRLGKNNHESSPFFVEFKKRVWNCKRRMY